MKIDLIPLDGLILRALVVSKSDPCTICEDCGKPCYSHELLAKTSPDWCMTGDDKHHRGHMSDEELSIWTVEQMSKGLAVIVATQDIPDFKLSHLGL